MGNGLAPVKPDLSVRRSGSEGLFNVDPDLRRLRTGFVMQE